MYTFFTGIFVICAVILVGLIMRKLPQVRMINIETIPKERERLMKEQIILTKIQRLGLGRLEKVLKVVGLVISHVSKQGRRAVQRLYKLEQYYQKLKKTNTEGVHTYSEEVIDERLDKALQFIKEGETIPAEKLYIDIISHNPKCVDAYEALGNMYLEMDQLDQARETFAFALRLAPNDASIHVSMAELEIKKGNVNGALPHLRKAIEKRSRNPKYLDYYIETSLKAGSLKDAQEGIKALKEVNPENQKIEEFETRFVELKKKYTEKTQSSTSEPSQE